MVQRTDPETKRARLEAWLRTRLPAAEALSIGPLEKATSGYASEIHFFDLYWREGGQERTEKLVVREAPTVLQIHPDYDVAAQFRIMRCLENSSVPMPKTYWLEEDEKVLGAPFFVMEKVEGEILDPRQPGEEPRGPLYEATPELRGEMWRQAIEVMAEVNTLDWEQLGLSFLGVPKGGTDALDRQIAHYERMWTWGGVEPQSLFSEAFAWFRDNRFEPEHISLCWGDARLGNLLYRDGEIVAVLDWDMAHIGAPEADLAWLLAIEWMSGEATGPPWEGVPNRGEIIRCYESMTGRRLQNFHYHEAFAMLKLGILFCRVICTMPGIPSDFAASGDLPPVRRLTEMLASGRGRMITKFDEFLCHQIVSTFDEVYTTDQQWYDRLWLTAHDNSGKILIDVGFGKYINRNVMDAHGGVTVEDTTQYTVRASRELWPDLDTVEVGPLSYEVLEPLKKIHVCLGENDYGISFDMEFDGVMAPWDEEPTCHRLPGVMTVHSRRYYQFGRLSGKVTVEGKTHEINRDTWWGQRDRSWGIRPIGVPRPGGWWSRADAGEPESGLQPWPHIPGLFFHYFFMQFKDYGLVFTFSEAPDGTPAGAHGGLVYRFGDTRFPVRVTDVQHQFEFFPGSRRVKSIELVVTTADGVKREISVKPLNVYYARAGGYLDGYKGWVHGKWRGPYAIDGEKLDLADQEVRDDLSGAVDDTMCEFRCGNDVGYGILEPFVIGELPKYGFKA